MHTYNQTLLSFTAFTLDFLQKETGQAYYRSRKKRNRHRTRTAEMASTALETCTLKVHMNCMGCIRRVKKLLRRIEGVYKVEIDAEEQKVMVTGMVDPATLVHKLVRSGKHAEVWCVPNEEQTIPAFEDRNNLQQIVNIPGSSEMQMLPDFGSIGDSLEHQYYSNQDKGTEVFTGGHNENLTDATSAQNASMNVNHTLWNSVVPVSGGVGLHGNAYDHVGLQGHCPPYFMSNLQAYYPSYIQAKMMPLYYYSHLPQEMNIYRGDALDRLHMMLNHNSYTSYAPILDHTSSRPFFHPYS